jgi:hypothetical protein
MTVKNEFERIWKKQENVKGTNRCGNPDVGRTIQKWILQKQDIGLYTDINWFILQIGCGLL